MGDTPRSQTISTQNQEIATQDVRDSGEGSDMRPSETPPILVRESSLVRIEVLAKADPNMVFTSLAHRIDLSLLGKSFRELRKK